MPAGKEIIERADGLLSDADHTRWPLAERADWINEAVRAIILAKPSASSQTTVIALNAGTLQAIPQTGTPTPLRLIDVVRNIISESPLTGGAAITPVGRNILDAQEPHWHDERYIRQRKAVTHVIFDEDNPLQFYVYPGNDGTGKIEGIMSVLPAPLTASGDASSIDSYAGDIGLPEPYSVPVLDYLCYRCLLKDDLHGAPARAMNHYQRFAEAVGIKIQVEGATSPNARRGAP
ncbi:DUF6682 family protein [Oricola sp.]|uniref:phage adaptor protein n=1 Tax=Oricola sp. TaxID=1979950 RepID=UPI003BAD964F